MNSLKFVLHRLRPLLWLIIWAHCLTGYVIALASAGHSPAADDWLRGLAAGGIWTIALVAPALAIAGFFNEQSAANEKHEGVLTWSALSLMLSGIIFALLISWEFFDIYLIGIAFTAVYAAPPVRLARWEETAWLSEAAGFAALSFFAGCAAAGGFPFGMAAAYAAAFSILYCSLRLLLSKDDSRNGSLLFIIALGAGFIALGGSELWNGERWSVCLLSLPLACWCLCGWGKCSGAFGRRTAAGLGFGAWLLTDISVALTALL